MRKYATNTRTEFSYVLNNTSMFSAKYVSAGVLYSFKTEIEECIIEI